MALLEGSNDDDQLLSPALSADTLLGGEGNDTLGNEPTLPAGVSLTEVLQPGDLLIGGAGDDLLIENPLAPDTLYGGDGEDEVSGFSLPDLDTTLSLDALDLPGDLIFTEAGNDTIRGFASPQTVFAGNGEDVMLGGDVAQLVYGNQGLDTLIGGGGNDTLYGGQNAGDLTLDVSGRPVFQEGVEFLFGDGGRAFVKGGATEVTPVVDINGQDLLYGNVGSDVIDGGGGGDTLYGGQGADTLVGGDGADRLFGNRGDDLLAGGGFSINDNSIIDFGNGEAFPFDVRDGSVDRFIFGAAGNNGQDTIIGFEAGIDEIQFVPGTAFTITDSGDDLLISLTGSADTITLVGLEDVDIAADITTIG